MAVTDNVPDAVGVTLTEHEADEPVPANVQVPLGANVTVPVGVLGVPRALSVTVAVHDVAWPITTVDGVHVTLVAVDRVVTVTDVLPLLVA